MALACLDLGSGRPRTWPYPAESWARNSHLLDAMHQVWRVVHLYHKPKARRAPGGGTETNWTPDDIDLWDWLENGE